MANKKQKDNFDVDQIAASIEPVDIKDYMIDYYHQYKSYIIAGRVCCNYMDGFLNVHKRILYAAYKYCRNHLLKSATLAGKVVGEFSPHGDCYSSLCKLVSQGLLVNASSFENNFGVLKISAAAPRYTETMLTPIAETLFLNSDLLPYVDYAETELSTADVKYFEPVFLPALVPGIYTAIAETSEFSSYMALKAKPVYPKYAVLSILDYVIHYLKTGIFEPSLLYYQHHNIIKKNTNNDYDTEFSETFACPIEMDEDNNVHLLSTLPFVKMISILKNIPYEDLTTMSTDIVIPKKYYSKIKFTKNINFNVKAFKLINNDYSNVIMVDYPIQFAIKVILNNLKNIIYPRYFTDKINKTKESIKEYQLLKQVHHKYVDLHIPYDQMNKEEQAVANKHRISTFMKIDDKINSLQDELKIYEERSKDIDGEILKLYTDAKEKCKKYLDEYWKENDITLYDISNL